MTQVQYNPIDVNEILSTVARQMRDQFSEEEIEGQLGRAFNKIISLGYFDEVNLSQINDTIVQCQNTIILKNNINIINVIRVTQQKMSAKVIRNSTITSSVIIILQVVKLHFVWKEISVAKNLHNDSTKFEKIQENIVILTTIIEQLTQTMRTNDITQVSRINACARTKCNETKSLINNLQVKINGSLKKLEISSDGQILDGFSNFVSTVGISMKFIDLFRFDSTSNTIFGIGIIAAFTLLIVANTTNYYITKKRLNELREDINCLNNLNQQLNQLYQMVEEPENFL
jgi:hypothetical protein